MNVLLLTFFAFYNNVFNENKLLPKGNVQNLHETYLDEMAAFISI